MNLCEQLLRYLDKKEGSIRFSRGARNQKLVTITEQDKITMVVASVKEVMQKLKKPLSKIK